MVGEIWRPVLGYYSLPAKPGLYIVRNTVDNKQYVGISRNVRERVYAHTRPHVKLDKVLYRAMLKHGLDKFEVCLYMEAEVSDLPALEILLIEELDCFIPKGYNMTKGGEGSLGVSPSPERRKQIGEFTKLHHTGLKRSPEACKRIGEGRKGKGVGYKPTDEVRAKMSEARKGVVLPHMLKITGEANPMFSKPSPNRRPVLLWEPEALTPKEFESACYLAEYLGVSVPSVSGWCTGRYAPKLKIAVAYAK